MSVQNTNMEPQRSGVYLGAISIWFVFFGIIYSLNLLIISVLWGFRYNNGAHVASDAYLVFGTPFMIAMIAIIWVFTTKKFNVGTAKFLGLTFLGFRFRMCLKEGDYYFEPESFLLGATTKTIQPFTDDQGRLEAGPIAFQLWNTSDHIAGKKPNLQIQLNAKHGAGVILAVTLKGILVDPQKTLTPNDAPLLFGDSGRKSLRRASTVLIDLDISEVPGTLGELMLGHDIVSARLSDTFKQHREGSLLFDKGGNRYFEVVRSGESVEAAIAKLTERFTDNQKRFDPKVIELVTDNGDLRVDVISIETTLVETAHEIGFWVDEVLVSDVELSEPVQKSVNKASAEPHEASSELATAISARASAAEYAEAQNEHGRDAALLGAAATGTPGVQTINIPGLTKLAEVLGSLAIKKGT